MVVPMHGFKTQGFHLITHMIILKSVWTCFVYTFPASSIHFFVSHSNSNLKGKQLLEWDEGTDILQYRLRFGFSLLYCIIPCSI
jgi:hypothetical protein